MNTHPHPEWKRLLAEAAPLVTDGKSDFSYEELNRLAGVDIRTSRGRQQFHRFAKAALKQWSVHFECVRNQGYRIVRTEQHAICASKRVKRAKRQLRRGRDIAVHTKIEELSAEQRRNHELVLAGIGAVLHQVSQQEQAIRKVAAAVETKQLPSADSLRASYAALGGDNAKLQ